MMNSTPRTADGEHSGGPPATDRTLTVVMRFHAGADLALLEEALFSLAIQDYDDLEVVVAVQNGSPELAATLADAILSQPWRTAPRWRVHCEHLPPGVDGRSRLLNRGRELAVGRYLAFLDYDDFVYHHGYARLVARLRKSGAGVAVGGCRMCEVKVSPTGPKAITKSMPYVWGHSRVDLLHDNFVPIHSYVVDRRCVSDTLLTADETLAKLEDYDLLLRMATECEFDFKEQRTPVCEYRVRNDGTNTVITDQHPASIRAEWAEARKVLLTKVEGMTCRVRAIELLDLRSTITHWREQAGYSRKEAKLFREHSRRLEKRLAEVDQEYRAHSGILEKRLAELDAEQRLFSFRVYRRILRLFAPVATVMRHIGRLLGRARPVSP